MSKIRLNKFNRPTTNDLSLLYSWLEQLDTRVGEGPFLIKGYAVASLPPAAQWGSTNDFTSIIYVVDEVGGATLAFSDGTNWRRVQDRVIVS